MSYCVSVQVRAQGLHHRMLAFFKQNYRTYPALEGNPDGFAAMSPPGTHQLWYAPKLPRLIGIDYNTGDGERRYAWALMAWIAIKVGRRVPIRGLVDPIPFFYYDHDKFLIRLPGCPRPSGKWPNLVDRDRWGVAHKDAMRKHPKKWVRKETEGWDRVITQEIKRLDSLWMDACIEHAKG